MHKGIAAYRFPSKEICLFKGNWVKETMNCLPKDCFFVSDFTSGHVFYLKNEETVASFSQEDFFFKDEEDVFVSDPKSYLNGLQFFIDGFEREGIQKAIYSRIKVVDRLPEDDLMNIFKRLCAAYKEEAFVYLISDEQFGTWIGATPEVLLSGNEQELQTMALAGTKHEQQTAWTSKEKEEHQYVVDYITEKIRNEGGEQLEILPTSTVKAGAVYHLKTAFSFHLPSQKWNSLLTNLHPTPAVCGTPQEAAMNYILRMEPHEREFYAGMIGRKSEDWLSVYVNLRCMQVLNNKFALYLGGGITPASEVQKEFQETEDKSQTLLNVI